MKRIICILCFVFVAFICKAQDEIPVEIKKSYHHILTLIKEDKAEELSQLFTYPIKRQDPLPDIATANDFITHYSLLIDAAFKKKLQTFNDSDIFLHHDSYGLVGGDFDGDIWLNDEGKIEALNYSSAQEQQQAAALTAKIKSQMHPSVNSWDNGILVARYENLLIRLDRVGNDIRYVCWSKGHTISDKPDIVLHHGVEEAQGTQGGFTWTFNNDGWTYEVDEADMCDEPKNCGLFLNLSFKGTPKSSVRLKQVKY